MECSRVKELIQTWRNLSSELKGKNVELEKTRVALNELEAQHAKTVQDWDIEKANIQNTISVVRSQVSSKKEELMRIEKEASELQRKVDERRLRNEEHWRVLNKRKQAVATQLQELDEKDKGARERLSEFRAAQEESRRQLLSAIRKIEDAAPQEQVDHQHKVRQTRSKIAEVEALTNAEKKSQALELAMRQWKQKNDARRWLFEEASAAEDNKGMWASIVKETNNLHCDEQLSELDSLRALLSC